MTDTLGKLHIAHTSGDLTEKESAGTTRIQPTLPKRDVQTLCQVCVCAMLLLICFYLYSNLFKPLKKSHAYVIH